MISFPNAKINIGLRITRKLDDGYHNIESIFYPIPLRDALEIVPSDRLRFTASGLPILGSTDDNLCLKAFHLLKNDFPAVEPVHIYLRKNIPMGAGLGGGSADGAFMINLLNDFFELGCDVEARENYVAQLGCDCPFFIENTSKLVTGRGEKMSPHAIDLSGWFLGLMTPIVHVSTQEAYAGIHVAPASVDWEKVSEKNVEKWSDLGVRNQFEDHIVPDHPEIASAKKLLSECGADYVSMTGSGSAVYGLFREKPHQAAGIDHILSL